jgi:hypothetical protein
MTGIMMSLLNSVPQNVIPGPVTAGLMYYIDAGDPASYPGSGSSMNNLAGTAPGASTLANSPTFTSAGTGSYFSFNGSTQIVYTPNLRSLFQLTDNRNLTLETWIRTSTDNGVIISEQGTSPINSGWHTSMQEIVSGNLRVRVWAVPTAPNLLVGAVTRNQWQQYVMTYDNATTTLRGYINGTTTTSAAVTRRVPWDDSQPELYYALMVADSTNMGDGSALAGDWAVCKIYNRALSQAEILQNYNAVQPRYAD